MFDLFSKKGKCNICGKEARKQVKDGYVCNDCFERGKRNINITKGLKNTKVAEVKEAIKLTREDEKSINNFKLSKRVIDYIHFDDENKKFLLPKTLFKKTKIYNYSEILGYEILENGDSITKGGLGSAIVGGALFGGFGAVVGGVTGSKTTKTLIKNLRVKIILDNSINPVEYIDIIMSDTQRDGFKYKMLRKYADDIAGILDGIMSKNAKINNNQATMSNADEILKYKKLMDDGIITEDEFMAKKKQLLGL